ncbi:hypothetical protein SEA_VITAS_66 [Microbacterium phage Vitas]|uniref:Uncharacterized protein n=1 Tax=Microbacterium phage Vitas TaxID=2603259 RepID=A0A5B8WHL2_9CAUD|nr:hypothetical protein SEA_VITAS_66 [Microbacterium phage Vitas]
MTKIAFAAEVLYGAGENKPMNSPARVASPRAAVVVRNPFTGFNLWLRAQDVVNQVHGIAAVLLEAEPSGRFPDSPTKRGFRDFINPLTGNTFQVATRAIIKETK